MSIGVCHFDDDDLNRISRIRDQAIQNIHTKSKKIESLQTNSRDELEKLDRMKKLISKELQLEELKTDRIDELIKRKNSTRATPDVIQALIQERLDVEKRKYNILSREREILLNENRIFKEIEINKLELVELNNDLIKNNELIIDKLRTQLMEEKRRRPR